MDQQSSPGTGHNSGLASNDPDTQEAIREGINDLVQLDQEAKALNAKRKEIRERLDARGIRRDALAFAKKLYLMDTDQRQEIALSLGISLAALGLPPVQADMLK